jgi:hypothetical protein
VIGEIRILETSQRDEWLHLLQSSIGYDFYHLPEYHALAENRGEGLGRLVVYREGHDFIALPLLVRLLDRIEGFDNSHLRYFDAASVYGYAGPIRSPAEPSSSFVRHFQQNLRDVLQDLRVVCAFSRMHPLLPQHDLLRNLGDCETLSQTVSIDLQLPPELQLQKIRKDHRDGIKKLRQRGVECFEDQQRVHFAAFVEIYRQTMERVGAESVYFFRADYFSELMTRLGDHFHLFVASLNGEPIAAGLFAECAGIVEYHLSGTDNRFLKLAPMKLILDTVRQWATARGQRVFHLGGGVGSREDSLLQFKAGFSDIRHDFRVWRWLIQPELYSSICQECERWNQANGLTFATTEFFPRYRTCRIKTT